MKKLQLLLFLCALVAFASCRKDKNTFDEKLVIDPFESVYTREFSLVCKTEKQYGCRYCTLSPRVERNGNSIRISFTGVNVPSYCAGDAGPATGAAGLGRL